MANGRRQNGEVTPAWLPQPIIGIFHFCSYLFSKNWLYAPIYAKEAEEYIPWMGSHLPAIKNIFKKNIWLTAIDLCHNSSLATKYTCVPFFPTHRIYESQRRPAQNQTQFLHPVQSPGPLYHVHIWLFLSGNLSTKVHFLPPKYLLI